MFKAAIKNLLGHKLRMFLTGFSIILGVSFVSGTYIFTDSIGSTFDNLFSEVYSGTDVSVRAKQADFGSTKRIISQELLDKVSAVDGVSAVAPEVAGYAQLIGKDEQLIGGQGPPTLGFEWTTEPSLQVFTIDEADGRAPTAPGEVVIDKATADANSFVVGDKVKILLQGPAEEFTLVGIAKFGSADGLAGATLAAFELSEAQRVLGYDDGYSGIDLKATNSVSPEELKARIDSILPAEYESITGTEQSNEQLDEINQGLGFINTALLAFAGIAIFVGSFIIQNTFRIIVAQRSKELALLRAIGATKVQVVRLVIYEAIFIALLASVTGILLGLVVSSGVRSLMNAIGFGLPEGPLSIEPRTIVVSLGVGMFVTLFAALLPAIKASKVSPIEAMRENEASASNRKSLFTRGAVGGMTTIIGAGLLAYGLNGDVNNPLYAVGAGVTLMFIGVSTIAPLLSVPLAQLISWPLVKTRGITARLARDNAKRTPRRTASSAAALMIGVSLVTMLSILATTFKSNITTILDNSFPADLSVLSKNIGDAGPGSAKFSSAIGEDIATLPEITDVSAFRYEFEGAKIDGQVVFIAGVDAATIGNVINIGESEGSYTALADNGLLVSKTVYDEKGWSVGQEIPIEYALNGEQMIKIVGFFTEAFDSDFIISTETYSTNFNDEGVTLLAMNVADGYSDDDGKVAVQNVLTDYPQTEVQDKGDIFKTAEEQIDQILGLFWGLLGFAIIIAVLGITNTLMLSISERTRELGMLRAIGMTREQTRRMIRYESIIIALFGAILGIGMGSFFAWAVLKALASEGISGYNVSFVQLLIYFILSIIAGVIAAAWPARKAARMNVLKAIYHD